MKFKSNIELQSGLKDSSGAIGTSGQLLSSTGTGVSWASLNGFVPYTGATQNVDLGIYTLLAAKGVFSSSGNANTVEIGHSSGSGIALNITKGGSGEGLYINKTSGSGNAATIIGILNATTLVKSGGTSAQILAADGTIITAGTNITISGGTISSTGGGVTSFNTRTGAVTLTSGDVTTALGYTPVPELRTITINGVTQDLSANRTFTVTTPETDTLATVTARGAITTSDIFTPNNGGIFFNGLNTYGSGVFGRNFGQDLGLNAGGLERTRIFSNGNVFIGSSPTDAGYKIDVNGTGRFSGTITGQNNAIFGNSRRSNDSGLSIVQIIGSSSNSTSSQLNLTQVWNGLEYPIVLRNTYNGAAGAASSVFTLSTTQFIGGSPTTTERFRIDGNSGNATFTGTVTATGFFNSSDIRLKNIISQDGDVIEFTWKDGRDNKTHVGYIAQEVQKTMPDAVNEGEDGMLSVNYIEVLVKKIQDLENRIKQLEK